MISMDKKYQYRNGEPARVLCTDAPGKHPVLTLLPSGDIIRHWADGKHPTLDTRFDLIEVQPFRRGDVVMVRVATASVWLPRLFCGVIEIGVHDVYETIEYVTDTGDIARGRWDYCRRPEPGELEGES